MMDNETVELMDVVKDRATFFSKMSRITGKVGNLKKDATNKFHKYDYVSADNVLQAIAPLLAEENIALMSETLEVGIDDKVYMPKYQFTFVCGDTGFMYPCIWFGETVHTSSKGTRDDKALNKSATISQKYFLLKTFLIATGDDPDGDKGDAGRKSQAKQSSGSMWPSHETVNWVMSAFDSDELSANDIFKLAGVTALNDGDGWRRYADPQAAVTAITEALDDVTSPHSNGYVDTFRFMSYIASKSNMQFSTHEEGHKNNTVAVCYGGRGAIKKWGGAELCEQLNLAQYDKLKDKNITSDFIPMTVPIEFHFEDDQSGSGFDFKVTGIKGDPEIPY